VIAVGIDLTGSETKPSGWACLRGREAELRRVRTDAELVEATLAAEPTVVSLDSPLGLPRMAGSIIRDAEREMMALRIGVYPCLLPSMVRLTERGIALKRVFEAAGLAVIEGFPGSAQDWLGIPRKKTDVGALRQGLEDYGLVVRAERISHDELDALTAALVGQFWLRGEFHAFGNEEEGVIVTPCRWRGDGAVAAVFADGGELFGVSMGAADGGERAGVGGAGDEDEQGAVCGSGWVSGGGWVRAGRRRIGRRREGGWRGWSVR
jgi:predicted nuclease with RNAse H fold